MADPIVRTDSRKPTSLLRRMRRLWPTIAALILGATIGWIGWTPTGHRWLFDRAAAYLTSHAGLSVRAEGVTVDPLRLSMQLTGVVVARTSVPGRMLLRVDSLLVDADASAMLGHPVLDRLVAGTVIVDARGGGPSTPNGTFRGLGRVDIHDLSVSSVSFLTGDLNELGFEISHWGIRGSGVGPGRLSVVTTSPGAGIVGVGGARIPLERISAAFRFEGTRVYVDQLEGGSPAGRVAARGVIRLEPSYPAHIEYESVLDLARVPSWWGSSASVRGRAEWRGELDGPVSHLEGPTHVDVGRFSWSALSPGTLKIDGRIGAVGVELSRAALAVPELALDGSGLLSWSARRPTSSFEFRWSARRLRRLGPLVDLVPGDIPLVSASGSGTLRWVGFVPAAHTVEGTLTTELRSDGGPTADEGRVRLAGRPGMWHGTWDHRLPGNTVGQAHFQVKVDAARFAASTILGELSIRADDVVPALQRAAVLEVPVPRTALERLGRGRFEAAGTLGGSVARPRWTANFVARDVEVAKVSPVEARGRFVVDPDQFVTENISVTGPASALTVEGSVGILRDEVSLGFVGHLESDWLARAYLPSDFGVSGVFHVEGRWRADRALDEIRTDVRTESLRFRGLDAGAVHATVVSREDETEVGGAAPGLGLTMSSYLNDAAPALSWVEASLIGGPVGRLFEFALGRMNVGHELTAEVDGRLRMSGDLKAASTTDLVVDLSRLDGTYRGRSISLAAPATLRWRDGAMSNTGAAIRVGDVSFEMVASEPAEAATRLHLSAPWSELLRLLPEDAVPANVRAVGSISVDAQVPHDVPWRPTARVDLNVDSLKIGRVEVGSGLRAEVTVDSAAVELTHGVGVLLGSTAAFSGRSGLGLFRGESVEVPGRFDLAWDVSVPALLSAAGLDRKELQGRARVSLSLEAAALSIKAVSGVLSATGVALASRGIAVSDDGGLRVRLRGGEATVESFRIAGTGSELRIRGSVGLEPTAPVALDLDGSAALALVDAFVGPTIDGRGDLSVQLRGTWSHPTVTGTLGLSEVSVVSPDARLVVAGLEGSIALSSGEISARSIRGQLNGGTFVLSGSFPYGGGTRRGSSSGIVIRLEDVFAEFPTGHKSRVSAELALTSRGPGSLLAGDVLIYSEPYRDSVPRMALLAGSLGSGPGLVDDANPGWFGGLGLDLRVAARVPLVMDNSAGYVRIWPRFSIRGTVARPELDGALELIDGSRIVLQSRVYQLSDSRLVFSPGRGFVPRVQVSGATRVGEHEVSLRLSGQLDSVAVSLSSDPPLPEADLRALLLTGQAESLAGHSGNVDNYALNALSSDLLGMAGQVVGLDSVRLGAENFELVASDVNPTTRLTVTKSLLDRVELVYSESLEDNGTTWIAIYRPRRNVEIRAASLDGRSRVVEFRHQLAFGPGGRTEAVGDASRAPAPAVLAEVVSRVEIIGLAGDLMDDVRRALKLRATSHFDYGVWTADVQRVRSVLASAGYLSSRVVPLRTRREGLVGGRPQVDLQYRVTAGRRSEIRIEGIPASRELVARLRAAWQDAQFDGAIEGAVSRAARGYLIDQGYVTPVIRTEVVTGPEVLSARVVVEPGPRPRARAVEFVGMQAFSELELVAVAMGSGTAEAAWRNPADLCNAVRSAYERAGYRAARVEVGAVWYSGSTAVLPVLIAEGAPSRVGSVELSGVGSSRRMAVLEAAGVPVGTLVVAGLERVVRGRVEQYYRDAGFRDVAVDVRVAPPQNGITVGLIVGVTEGRRHVIESVDVLGVAHSSPGFLSRGIRLRVGDPASDAAIAETQRRLYRLGVIHAADVRFVPVKTALASDSGDIPVHAVVSITEVEKYQVTYGLEGTNNYGPVFDTLSSSVGAAVDVRDRNLFGRGMSLSIGGRYDSTLKSARVLFGMPRLRTWPIATSAFLAWRDEAEDSSDGATARHKSQTLSVEQRWLPRSWSEVTWGYSLWRRDIAVTGDEGVGGVRSRGTLASLNLSVVVDKRDSVLSPTRGWFSSASLQSGGPWLGSGFHFSRFFARGYGFFRVGPVVSATALRLGALWDTSGTPTVDAADLLFHAGGTQTVRGYAQDQLTVGRLADWLPGGTRLVLANQEFRIRLAKRVEGVVFVDAGNTFAGGSPRLRDLAVGIGGGIRVLTPLAPLRLDVGFPIPQGGGERRYRWHVSVGHMF